MHRLGSTVMAAAAATLATLLAPAGAAAITWGVPGNGSNVCTVANPNCNTIAQAVTASSSGDTISIGAGTFPIPAVIVLTKTLTFTGAGIGSTIIQPTAAAFSVRTNNIVFQDFTLQNGTVGIAFQNAASNNTQITRVQFSGQTSRGIDISLAATFPVSNVAIANCQIATPNIGLRTSSAAQVSGLTITSTTFSGNNYGIYVANDGNTSRFSGLTIQNSTFSGNTRAIYAEELKDALIEDSTFSGPGSWGIQIVKFYGSNTVAVSNVTIRRNQFMNFAVNAIDFEVYALGLGAPGATIADNVIQQDVSLYAVDRTAVFLFLTPSLTHAPVTISGNQLALGGALGAASAAHGITLSGNGPVSVTGNTLDGGGVGGTGVGPASSGIVVQSRVASYVMPASVNITASCNRIQGFRNGISVFDASNGVYGGLQAGAAVTLASNAILGNDDGVVTAAAPPTIGAENNYWGCPLGPTDPACDGVVGDVDADPFLAVIPSCVACTANAECSDGLFCTGAETCVSGACLPGGGDPCTGGPACENVCNEAADDCIVPASTVCRPAAGDCDVAEACTGLGGACPADTFAPATTTCRAAAGPCDLAETCDGVTAACPADSVSGAFVTCRPAAGPCDVAETCDGATTGCPADAVEPASTTCRPAAGACDLADTCDGVGAACPADAKSTAVCRPTAGICDVADTCDGLTDACPADAFQPATTVCRPPVDTCDVPETCTGAGAACPADTGLPDTDGDTVCDAIDNCDAAANPGQENADSDALGNVCDPCTNVAGTTPSKAKLILSKLLAPATDDKLTFKGFFLGVPGTPTVNPVANGLRILVTDSTGATPIDVTLPGGAYDPGTRIGWKVNGAATAWKYSNPTSPVNGVTKAQLKAYPSTPGKYKFAVKGKDGNYAVNPLNLPLTGTLVIDTPTAETGQCGETAFLLPPAKPSCAVAGGGKTVKCK